MDKLFQPSTGYRPPPSPPNTTMRTRWIHLRHLLPTPRRFLHRISNRRRSHGRRLPYPTRRQHGLYMETIQQKMGSETEIGMEKWLVIRFYDSSWIASHIFNPNRLLIAVSKEEDYRGGLVIEMTKLSTTTDPEERHALCMCREQDLGNALEIGKGIVDVDWNLQDLGFVASF